MPAYRLKRDSIRKACHEAQDLTQKAKTFNLSV